MRPAAFEAIVHPTDFSEASDAAFNHALRIAVASKSAFYTLHIEDPASDPRRASFPHVRERLAAWSLLHAGEPENAVSEKLGVRITKATIGAHDIRHGILDFVERHECDLLVLASHDHGQQSWFGDTVSQQVARSAHVSTLFVREHHRGFVDEKTGACSLQNILLPVDAELHYASAWRKIVSFAKLFSPVPRIHLFHVGLRAPTLHNENGREMDLPLVRRNGPVVQTILEYADEIKADLIAMPTSGHHGVLDALRGSTTERVLREAPCPVLAVPVE
jgi:nucleotide-binding universal stress UspA family protein